MKDATEVERTSGRDGGGRRLKVKTFLGSWPRSVADPDEQAQDPPPGSLPVPAPCLGAQGMPVRRAPSTRIIPATLAKGAMAIGMLRLRDRPAGLHGACPTIGGTAPGWRNR